MFGNLLAKKIDPEPALRLLTQLAPDTPWVLRAQRGKGTAVVATLRPEQRKEAAAFITTHMRAGRSLAVLTAEPAVLLDRLPAPTDLRGTRYFGVSISMPADKQAGDLKARMAVKTLIERLTPKPFLQMSTMRGYECWWRLFNLLPPERAHLLAAQWAARIPGALPLDVFLELPDANRKLVQMDKAAIAVVTDFMAPPKAPKPSGFPKRAGLDEVDDRPVEWLWPQVAAIGKLNLVGGLPGSGKSQITLALAAALSAGRAVEGAKMPAGNVLILATEDDAGDTIKPRLRAAGADVRRITVDEDDYDLRNGAERLIQRAEEVDARLIIFDPIDNYVEGPAATVRRHLNPLLKWAAQRRRCLLAIVHPPKGVAGKSVQELFGGSSAFTRIARSCWLAFADDSEGSGMLLYAKGNIVKDKRGFAYRFEDIELPSKAGKPIETSRVRFEEQRLSLTADQFLEGKTGPAPSRKLGPTPDRPVFDATNSGSDQGPRTAVDWLRDALAAGPREGKELKAAAAAAGFHHPALYRAKKALGAMIRPSGFGKSKLWEL